MELNDLTIAKKQWFEGDSLEAGRLLFERIPPGQRAAWACRILEVAVRSVGVSNPLYDQLLTIQQSEWNTTKLEHFDRIRNQTLVLESSSHSWRPASQELILSYIAENVAKVIYNECETDDEFDEDSGSWVVRCLADLSDSSGMSEWRNVFWETMIRKTEQSTQGEGRSKSD